MNNRFLLALALSLACPAASAAPIAVVRLARTVSFSPLAGVPVAPGTVYDRPGRAPFETPSPFLPLVTPFPEPAEAPSADWGRRGIEAPSANPVRSILQAAAAAPDLGVVFDVSPLARH